MNDRKRSDRYWVGFNIVRGIGPTRLRALLDYFGDIEQAWHAPAAELRHAHTSSFFRRTLYGVFRVKNRRRIRRPFLVVDKL